MPRTWYAYLGGPLGDARLPANYGLTDRKPACNGGRTICAIYAFNGDISPTTPLSVNLLLYIANSRVSGVAEPQFPPGAKKYVYLID